MAEHIVRLAGVQPGDHVVEVGPGLGSLTLALCDAGAHVRAVELDRRLAAVLSEVVRGQTVDVVVADALEVDWPELLADHDRWIMVSNLPYNVATPVVVRALETAPDDRSLPRDGAARGGGAARRGAGHQGLRRGVGEGRVLRAGRRGRDRCRPRCSCRSRRSTARSCGCSGTRRRRSRSPIPSGMFELVRAGFATRRKMLRRALDADARRSRRTRCSALAGIDPSGPRRDAHAGAVGGARARPSRPASAPECRVDAFAKLTLSLHVTGHARRRLPRARRCSSSR